MGLKLFWHIIKKLVFLQKVWFSLIPLKLQIKNFLSYGPDTQEIDFTKYQMICLSGKNGHGKSALLDAMTWAVWGQARKSSGQPKPDHGLLHLGERNMKVIFDFEFNHKCYRVRREFTFAYGKPTAYLEFGMFTNQNSADQHDSNASGEFISLTDKTIRKTQAKIELLLGLDFDSFINSAFIRQGNSGEFSQKSPKERKEILGNILGLNLYDNLRKSASEKAKLLENERQVLLKLHEHLLLDLNQSGQIQELAQNLQIKLTGIKNQQLAFEQKTQVLVIQQKELELRQQFNRDISNKFTDLSMNYEQDLARLLKIKVAWRVLLARIQGVSNKKLLEAQKVELEKKLVDLRLRQKNSWNLREQLAQFKADYQKITIDLFAAHDQKINLHKIELEKMQINFEYEQANYAKSHQELAALQKNRELLFSKLHACDDQQVKYDLLQKKFDRYKDFYQRLIVMGNLAKSNQDELKRKQLYIDQDCPACPLCEQNLSAARKRFLFEQFIKQTNFANHRVIRVAKLLKELKTKIFEQHAELEKLKEAFQQVQIIQVQINHDQVKILELEKFLLVAQPKLTQWQDFIQAKKIILQDLVNMRVKILDGHDLVIKLNHDIKICEENLLQNNYQEADLQLFELNLEQVNHLLNTDNHENLLSERTRTLEQVRNLVHDLKNQKKVINNLQEQLKVDLHLKDDQIKLQKELDDLTCESNSLKVSHDQLLHQLGSVQEQMNKINKTKLELDKLRHDLTSLESKSQDYRSLVSAFGKDGIQALLIEDAIPEIEQEANDLLGRLTDNQAQLFIESLRDLKSGGTKETLDIKISDNVGLRPYEMFSGGEAFRIDFALRIAISKLLARRAGTALQTLIIDEGFGSQDEEGLAHIMDALYKIQEDFAKIIIVSHLNTMKEQFPVHFFINKTPTGSSVSVIEQG